MVRTVQDRWCDTGSATWTRRDTTAMQGVNLEEKSADVCGGAGGVGRVSILGCACVQAKATGVRFGAH